MSDFPIHKPSPKDGVKTPDEAVLKIRYSSFENLYVFKQGRQVRRFEGEENRITIEELYLREMKDAIVVHNHPHGSSFSIEDVQAICSYDAKELILVTMDFIYQINRPVNGWGIDFSEDKTKRQYEESQALAEDTAMKAIARNEISLHEKDVEIIHYIWISFFILNDVKYVRKKII
ncbi:MAG: hypothetical protein ACKVOQ_22115 [Cyclobacteriaceae bacterium]